MGLDEKNLEYRSSSELIDTECLDDSTQEDELVGFSAKTIDYADEESSSDVVLSRRESFTEENPEQSETGEAPESTSFDEYEDREESGVRESEDEDDDSTFAENGVAPNIDMDVESDEAYYHLNDVVDTKSGEAEIGHSSHVIAPRAGADDDEDEISEISDLEGALEDVQYRAGEASDVSEDTPPVARVGEVSDIEEV